MKSNSDSKQPKRTLIFGNSGSGKSTHAQELIFLNPGTAVCQKNCRSRPWEPHKYKSKEEQDKNLAMLLDWVAQYETRNDEFSLAAHRRLFEAFAGDKTEINSNEEASKLLPEK